ncbi:DUF7533 family protein [Natronorubrum aibiense]|uniref:Uncharacterized protein n=1 Tax=Natronorubrum aibiense TaxID=348826 RepID=A0A5P9P2S2_9EURY|nr:hypothetical protein [Natronorubrum aibiense]QFU82429.1 hypothetical protein GCU68_07795 [Natronorubrum aibiense]
MKGPGIFWMVQTAAGLSMAGPMFVVGVEFLRTGRPVAGVGFLALGAVALYFPTYLVNRIGGPRTWIRRRLGRDDTTEAESTTDAETTAENTGERTTLFDRLR